METLENYQYSVEQKTKAIFIGCLKKSLKKVNKKNFGFVGVIGSFNKKRSHDIDVLIFPSKNSKIGEAISATSKLYKEVDRLMKKEHERFYVAISPKIVMQEMIYYLSSLEEGSAGLIPVHSLFFTDYHSFKRIVPKNFEGEIKKSLITLYGNFNVIKSLPALPQYRLEPYFLILDFEMNSKIRTFPRHVIRSSAQTLFSYLKKKYRIKLENTKLHSINEIEKQFLNILKILDKRNYH